MMTTIQDQLTASGEAAIEIRTLNVRVAPLTLAMLDQQGHPIVSTANYTLTRVGAAPLTRRLALAGPRWALVILGHSRATSTSPAPLLRPPTRAQRSSE